MAGGDWSFGLVDTFVDLIVGVAVARGTDFEEQVIGSWLWGIDVVQFVWCIVLITISPRRRKGEQLFACWDFAMTLALICSCNEPWSDELLASGIGELVS